MTQPRSLLRSRAAPSKLSLRRGRRLVHLHRRVVVHELIAPNPKPSPSPKSNPKPSPRNQRHTLLLVAHFRHQLRRKGRGRLLALRPLAAARGTGLAPREEGRVAYVAAKVVLGIMNRLALIRTVPWNGDIDANGHNPISGVCRADMT